MDMSEKRGGRDISTRCSIFSDRINNCNLITMASSGPWFTLKGQTTDNGHIRMRLDRSLINEAWQTLLGSASLVVLPCLHGGHCPLLLKVCD